MGVETDIKTEMWNLPKALGRVRVQSPKHLGVPAQRLTSML